MMDRLDWLYKYKPIPNHFVGHDVFGWCYNADRQPLLFDSMGEELDFIVEIVKEDPARVWTWTCAGDSYFIVCGFNTIPTGLDEIILHVEGDPIPDKGGYFVTDKPGIIGETRVYYTRQDAFYMDRDLTDWY